MVNDCISYEFERIISFLTFNIFPSCNNGSD